MLCYNDVHYICGDKNNLVELHMHVNLAALLCLAAAVKFLGLKIL
jgi:hypothetical protein